MTINEAVVRLRGRQPRQVFATRLGLSMTAVQNYERSRLPDARATAKFMQVAAKNEQFDIEDLLKDHMRSVLGLRHNQPFCLNKCHDCLDAAYEE